MTDLGFTIRDFKPESGWPDEVWGKSLKWGREAASLLRYNAEILINEEEETLTTKNGKRSVYLDFDSPISTGVVEINFKCFSPSSGRISFIFECGNDPKNPLEVKCNQELNDMVFLHIGVRDKKVKYYSAEPSRFDPMIKLLTDNEFKLNKWYDVKIILDYDKLNEKEDWISFNMTDEDGEVLVDTTMSHLSQAISTNLSQFRISVAGCLIKDFQVSASELPTYTAGAAPITASKLAPVIETSIEETFEDLKDEDLINKLSEKVIVSTKSIAIPEYVIIANQRTMPAKDYDQLCAQRKNLYSSQLINYRNQMRSKIADEAKLAPYTYKVFSTDVNNIITTNDFADKDYLINLGYKCIYIGYKSARRRYPLNYGTYEGRNIHVIPDIDYNRCDYICDDTNASEVLSEIFELYKGTPLAITFLDGDYKFDITGGDGSEESPFTCIDIPQDNVILRTFDYNTNFTITDKSKLEGNKHIQIFNIGDKENITTFNLNCFLEDMPEVSKVYNYPQISERLQSIVDYTNSLEQYPGINTVSTWVSDGLPSEIIENISLKETNSALESAVLELAQMVSDLQGGLV